MGRSMKTSSAKAKGRRAVKELKEMILKYFPEIPEHDLYITASGVNGVDLHLSGKAREILPAFAIEVKNQEKVNLWGAMDQAVSNCQSGSIPIVFAKKNRSPLRVFLNAEVFFKLIKKECECRKLS